jgi:aryl-alcohol dehydrogenase-like predicted oxidoreductase
VGSSVSTDGRRRRAIVGTRSAPHIDDAIAAASLKLDADAIRRIKEIVAAEVPVGGPTPEGM